MDNARQGRKVALWVAGAVVAVGALVVALVALGGSPETDDPSRGSAEASDGCSGVVGQSIDLDEQVVDPPAQTCFVLAEASSVTIGAAALEPSDTIELAVYDAEGEELATALSAEDWDPEVVLELEPGSYGIEVADPEADTTPPFLLYTATFVPQAGDSGDEADTASVPLAEACGADVPLLADDAPVSVAPPGDSALYACVEVTEPVFAKIGLASDDPHDAEAPDLTMAIFRVGDTADETTLVRAADDAIGFDPETSLELESGTYMIEATSWQGGPTGALEFYYDDDADLFRQGEATSMHAEVTDELCEDAPAVSPGDTLTVDDERTYVCLDVAQTQRLTIQAATLTDQDLVLEVLGYDEEPYRLAWADGSPYSDALGDFDPLLDQTIPDGRWIVAVTTYFTGSAADFDLRIVEGGGQ